MGFNLAFKGLIKKEGPVYFVSERDFKSPVLIIEKHILRHLQHALYTE